MHLKPQTRAVFLVVVQTWLGLVTPSFLPVTLLQDGNVCPVPLPLTQDSLTAGEESASA